MYEQQLIQALNKDLLLSIADVVELAEIEKAVKQKVGELLQTDFNALLTLLYRIDVSEEKLKLLLETNKDTDAADIISRLIVERQLQKIKSRNQFRNNDSMSDEEKW
ncbi:MAG: hypothetical protein ACTHLE_22060 [Agriterribacter sp.]